MPIRAFTFKTEPNRAFSFSKSSYFWLFSVNFFKEYNFLIEKTHFWWCLQDYTLKNWQKCWESASFFAFQGNSVFLIIEQAELSRAFWKAWRAEPSFFPQKLEPKPSRTEPSFDSDPTLITSHFLRSLNAQFQWTFLAQLKQFNFPAKIKMGLSATPRAVLGFLAPKNHPLAYCRPFGCNR